MPENLSVFDNFGGYYSVMLDGIEFARFAPSPVWSDMAIAMEKMYGDSFSYIFVAV